MIIKNHKNQLTHNNAISSSDNKVHHHNLKSTIKTHQIKFKKKTIFFLRNNETRNQKKAGESDYGDE